MSVSNKPEPRVGPPKRKAASNIDFRGQQSDGDEGSSIKKGGQGAQPKRVAPYSRHRACAIIWKLNEKQAYSVTTMVANFTSVEACSRNGAFPIKLNGYSWFSGDVPVEVGQSSQCKVTMRSIVIIFRSVEAERSSRWENLAKAFGAFNYVLRHGTRGKHNPYTFFATYFNMHSVTLAVLDGRHTNIEVRVHPCLASLGAFLLCAGWFAQQTLEVSKASSDDDDGASAKFSPGSGSTAVAKPPSDRAVMAKIPAILSNFARSAAGNARPRSGVPAVFQPRSGEGSPARIGSDHFGDGVLDFNANWKSQASSSASSSQDASGGGAHPSGADDLFTNIDNLFTDGASVLTADDYDQHQQQQAGDLSAPQQQAGDLSAPQQQAGDFSAQQQQAGDFSTQQQQPVFSPGGGGAGGFFSNQQQQPGFFSGGGAGGFFSSGGAGGFFSNQQQHPRFFSNQQQHPGFFSSGGAGGFFSNQQQHPGFFSAQQQHPGFPTGGGAGGFFSNQQQHPGFPASSVQLRPIRRQGGNKSRVADSSEAVERADSPEAVEGRESSPSSNVPLTALPVPERRLLAPPALHNASSWEKMLSGVVFTADEESGFFNDLVQIFSKATESGVTGYAAVLNNFHASKYLRVALDLEAELIGLLKAHVSAELPAHLSQFTEELLATLSLGFVEDGLKWEQEFMELALSQEQAFDIDPLTLFSSPCHFFFCVHVVRPFACF